MNEFMKQLVDLIYGTKNARNVYQSKNPSEIVLAANGVKGIITINNQNIKRGLNWAISKRAVIILTNNNQLIL